ncbi:transcriptional regulator [Pseudomonas alkylphenolica]|uniref:Transcriptional regulator n=1 Tax=Pseudomonas alkylphenolica TaxID=237609 RepID=A0A443ZJM0_9PSED|nr:helix-turn-helix transcriptional regulator [Pseudomonas alkylphenolica]RWU19129.1 transcriptional regulator [Pseudomonas alkylphenolica]
MNGIGARLREERERLGLTQRVFGDIGGVEPNAQGKYESGERTPKADYLAAVAARGVDALYVLNGIRTPVHPGSVSPEEDGLLDCFRQLAAQDQAAVRQLLASLAAALPRACTKMPGTPAMVFGSVAGKHKSASL